MSPLDVVAHRNTSFQPLPRPLGLAPYHYDLTEHFPDIAQSITAAKKMVFHVVGDSGGVKDAEFQGNVAEQMVEQLHAGGAGTPRFCYHVGDVVYFTGAKDEYYGQFYEPYGHYDVPIFSIPGNHDGEVDDPSAQTSLDGWVQYFMQAHPDVDPISKDAPRVQLNQPNVYWTLIAAEGFSKSSTAATAAMRGSKGRMMSATRAIVPPLLIRSSTMTIRAPGHGRTPSICLCLP